MSLTGSLEFTRVMESPPGALFCSLIDAAPLLSHLDPTAQHAVEWGLLFGAPILGLLMISRMPFSHVMNRYFDKNRVGPLAVVILVILLYLVVSHFVETVAAIFVLYAISGPLMTLSHRVIGFPRDIGNEDHDEELEHEPSDDAPLDHDGSTGTEGTP